MTDNKLLPNSFQTPNILIDRLMPLLSNDELRVVLFAARHIYGWTENLASRSAPLSLTAFERGHRGSAGCGLHRPAIHAAIKSLEAFGVMRRVGVATARGQRWAMAERDADIRWSELEARRQALEEVNRKRTAKAVSTSAKRRSVKAPKVVRPTYQDDGMPDVPASRYAPHTTGMPDIPPGGTSHVPAAGTSHVPIETHVLKPSDDDESSDPLISDHHQGHPLPSLTPDELSLLGTELRGLGLSTSVRKTLQAQGIERALALVLHAKGTGRNPAGLLVKMLSAGDEPAARYLEAARGAIEYQALIDDATQIATARRAPAPEPPQPVGLDRVVGERNMRIGDTWHVLLGQLELQLNRATFDTWLKGSVAERYEDGVLWVRARHPYAREWLEKHLQRLVDTSMSDLAGAPMRVRFVSEEAA